jgi:hypothetical protein
MVAEGALVLGGSEPWDKNLQKLAIFNLEVVISVYIQEALLIE